MNIYKCSQKVNVGYDTFDSFVCYANNEQEAKNMQPADWSDTNCWCDPKHVTVEFIGTLSYICDNAKAKVILASFNAG